MKSLSWTGNKKKALQNNRKVSSKSACWSKKEIQVLQNERAKYELPNLCDWKAISESVSSVESIYRSEYTVRMLSITHKLGYLLYIWWLTFLAPPFYSSIKCRNKYNNILSWSEKEIQALQNEKAKFKPPTPIDWEAISKSVSSVELIYRSEKAVSILTLNLICIGMFYFISYSLVPPHFTHQSSAKWSITIFLILWSHGNRTMRVGLKRKLRY